MNRENAISITAEGLAKYPGERRAREMARKSILASQRAQRMPMCGTPETWIRVRIEWLEPESQSPEGWRRARVCEVSSWGQQRTVIRTLRLVRTAQTTLR